MSLSFKVPEIVPVDGSWQKWKKYLEINLQEEKVRSVFEEAVCRPVQTKCARGCVWLFVEFWQFSEQFHWRPWCATPFVIMDVDLLLQCCLDFVHFLVECFFRKSCLQDPNKYWKCFHIMSWRHWLLGHWLVHFNSAAYSTALITASTDQCSVMTLSI